MIPMSVFLATDILLYIALAVPSRERRTGSVSFLVNGSIDLTFGLTFSSEVDDTIKFAL
jgi:hypothetical protein